MKSIIRTQIEMILHENSGICYIDPRKKGYRMKFPFQTANISMIQQITALPHIIKAGNITSFVAGHGNYNSFCIWFDCRPSSISWKEFDLNIKEV